MHVNNTPGTGLNTYVYFNDSLETNIHTGKIQISEHELQKRKTNQKTECTTNRENIQEKYLQDLYGNSGILKY